MQELHPHESMLRDWLGKRFNAISDFEDIIQEAYIRTVKRHRSNTVSAPKAFLFATARNLCLDAVRRNKVIPFVPLDSLDSGSTMDESTSAPDRMVAKEQFEIQTQAIQSLPKKCRRIFTLRKVYGLSLKQIAQELGISVKTVEAQISIGIKKSRQYFDNLQDEISR